MPLIYDVMTAGNVSGYWNASQQAVDSTIGEKVFPAQKQLGLKLSYVQRCVWSSGRIETVCF